VFLSFRGSLHSRLCYCRACKAICRSRGSLCHYWSYCHHSLLPRWCILSTKCGSCTGVEATTELQHVGWYWELHKGERKYTSPAVEAESFPSGYFSSGRDFAYYGSAAVRWPKISQRLYVEVVLGRHPSLINSAHWQNFERDAKVLYKHHHSVQILYFVRSAEWCQGGL
jgi:hypothetical protein